MKQGGGGPPHRGRHRRFDGYPVFTGAILHPVPDHISIQFFIYGPSFLVTPPCPDGQRRASGEGRLLANSGGRLGLVHD